MRRRLQLAVLCLATAGCAGIARDVARETAPAMVEGSVEGIADPKTQKRLVESIDPEKVQDGTQRITGGSFDGLIAALSEPERKEQLLAIMEGFRLNMSMREISASSVPPLVHAAAEAMRQELAGTSVDRAAMGSVTRELSKQATLGFQDALDEVRRAREAGEKEKGEGSVLWAASEAAESGDTLLWIFGIGAAALILVNAVLLTLALRSRRRHRSENDERDAALVLLAQAIKDTESQPWSNELRQTLKDSLRDKEGSEYLRRILRDHRDLRLRPNTASPPPPNRREPATAH